LQPSNIINANLRSRIKASRGDIGVLALQNALAGTALPAGHFGFTAIQGLGQIDGQSPFAYMSRSNHKVGVRHSIGFEAVVQQR
jgi:hypothetical protein